MRTARSIALTLAAVSALACSGEGDEAGKRRIFSRGSEAEAGGAATFDPARPEAALALSAEEVASRVGSFEWTAAVDWSVSRAGEEAARVRAAERHRLRQLASGDFELEADLDPGLGAGSETGKQVIWTGGTTYARARGAPFRERPTDRGRDARRFREESFGLARELAVLLGPALRLEPAGEATALGRRALRYRVALAPDAPPSPAPARTFPGGAPDPDTARRLAFLDGRVPRAAEGELLLDAKTGAPLRARLAATFAVAEAPGVTAQVELLAQVKALGEKVAAVSRPKDALPDVRKPPGVAGALEAAGLRKRDAEAKPPPAEPEDEAGE
jgi:hypothetical protein